MQESRTAEKGWLQHWASLTGVLCAVVRGKKYLFRHTFYNTRHFKRYKIRHFVVVFLRPLKSKIRHLKGTNQTLE